MNHFIRSCVMIGTLIFVQFAVLSKAGAEATPQARSSSSNIQTLDDLLDELVGSSPE